MLPVSQKSFPVFSFSIKIHNIVAPRLLIEHRIQVSLAELLAADRTNTITLSCGRSSHVSISFPHLAARGKTATQSSESSPFHDDVIDPGLDASISASFV